MKANETKVEDFLSSNKTQFVIPVYQRNFDSDLLDTHYLLGSLYLENNDKKHLETFEKSCS